MAEYWGLEAICKRLGVKDHRTVVTYYTNWGLPLLKRRCGSHPRLWWWTEDCMVLAWELKMALMGRDKWVRQKPQVSDAMVRRMSVGVDDAQASSKPGQLDTRDMEQTPLDLPVDAVVRRVSSEPTPLAKSSCTCGTTTPCRAHD